MHLFNWKTGKPVRYASDLNYVARDTCDSCDKEGEGQMLHAAGATGRVCPVLFLCFECQPASAAATKEQSSSD